MPGLSDSGVLARLEAIKSVRPSPPLPPLDVDVKRMTRWTTANLLLLRLRNSRAGFESILDSKSFNLHRPS